MAAVGAAAIGRPREGDRVRRRPIGDRFLSFFMLVLCGYAVGSKGFAYLGYPPIFVGELSLLAGVFALWVSGRTSALLREPTAWLLVAFMGFSAARTVPF